VALLRMGTAMGERARYLYAITRNLPEGFLDDARGLGGNRLETVDHRGLAAIVSDVDLDEFGEEALKQNLEHLEWLETVARTHDDVIHRVAAAGPTAPLRLATICLDDDGVRRRLDDWYVALGQVLDRVEGRREWSVKVFTPADVPESVGVGVRAAGGGADYLRQKKAALDARAAADDVARRVGEEVYATLSGRAVASRRLPAQDPRLTGHSGTMLLNCAFLVEVDEEPSFEADTDALRRDFPSVEISCAGPWPPYSFAMLEQR